MEDRKTYDHAECRRFIRSMQDTMEILGGKWKVYIIAALYTNSKRYSDLLKDVEGISGKMLSRELKEMELNQLITRTVLDTQPVTVRYQLTEYGETLKPIVHMLADWGHEHRRKIIGK